MRQVIMDWDGAEAYVRALFQYVLGRSSVTEAEVEGWTREIMAGHGVADVLRLFFASDETRLRQQALMAQSVSALREPALALVKRLTAMTVQAGPFAGLRFGDVHSWGDGSDIGPQLLGTYEQELHETIFRIVERRPASVVNIGCAEGYYTVGLARLLPQSRVWAFDIDPAARAICAENASLNGVAERIRIRGECTPTQLLEIAAENDDIFALIDCEGYERRILINAESSRALRRAYLIIELHEHIDPEIASAVFGGFSGSHRISIIRSGGRNPFAFPFLDLCSDAEKWMLLCENRPRTQIWLVCEPLSDRR